MSEEKKQNRGRFVVHRSAPPTAIKLDFAVEGEQPKEWNRGALRTVRTAPPTIIEIDCSGWSFARLELILHPQAQPDSFELAVEIAEVLVRATRQDLELGGVGFTRCSAHRTEEAVHLFLHPIANGEDPREHLERVCAKLNEAAEREGAAERVQARVA